MKDALIVVAVAIAVMATGDQSHAGEWDVGAASSERGEALHAGNAVPGTVVQVRDIEIAPTTVARTTSTGAGAIVGGAIGNKLGGRSGSSQYISSALGAILGGVLGNMAGEKISSAKGQEIIVRKDDGGLISVTQAESSLYKGQSVFLVETQGKVRVIPVM